jgi:two-component SAPR family response regulator
MDRMTDRTLRNCRIMVVEDEYLLVDELRAELCEAGAIMLGPAGTLTDALALIETEEEVDGVILDVNLHGEMAFTAADRLVERGVPFVFVTGYDGSSIPPRFRHVVCCEKPVSMRKVSRAIGRLAA